MCRLIVSTHRWERARLGACTAGSQHLGPPPTETRHSFTASTFTATLYSYCKRTEARVEACIRTTTTTVFLHHIHDTLLNTIHLSPSSQAERRQVKPGRAQKPTLPPMPPPLACLVVSGLSRTEGSVYGQSLVPPPWRGGTRLAM